MVDILFITPTDRMELNREVNGTMILATKLLREGFNVQVLRFGQFESNNRNYKTFIQEISEKILRIAPKCVSFYTLWPYYHIMLRIACRIKEAVPDTIIVFGGPQASATAMATMTAVEYVDYVCTGEGENTVVQFFTAILENKSEGMMSIPGLYYRDHGDVASNNSEIPLCDLEEIPYWDERLLAPNQTMATGVKGSKGVIRLDVGRGCPYSCTFCCTSLFWRRTYRLKSADRIIKDIRHYQEYGYNGFLFSHDAFTANKRLVEEVCNRIIEEELNIKWKCESRVDCLTEDLVLKMKQAGMIQIELGIETGSSRMQKIIKKNLNLDKAKRMIAFLLENKIQVHLFFMYGFPEETEQDLSETLELLFSFLDMGVQGAELSFCKFAPATAMTEKYFDQLVWDPNIKILSRGMFGYKEELELIQNNKEIFPHYYHLKTALREDYQYLQLLGWIYGNLPNSIKHLRKLYAGNNLRFYRDFYEKNLDMFEGDIDSIVVKVRENAVIMLENLLEGFDVPYKAQLKSLIGYDYNVQRVSKAKTDIEIRETYNFRYVDVKLKQPIEKFAEGQTEILLRKKDGKMDMKILRIV